MRLFYTRSEPTDCNLPETASLDCEKPKADLVGVAIFDRIDAELRRDFPLVELAWRKREIENYFTRPEVLEAYALSGASDDLFGQAERQERLGAMKEATDDLLDPVFKSFSKKLAVPLVLRKNEYHRLARFVDVEAIDPEVREKLDAILAVANRARPEGTKT